MGFLCAYAAAAPAVDVAPPAVRETVQVTATRVAADPLEVPVSIQVIAGTELERRHATTLSQALSLTMGVAVAPGGDGGPASAVPEIMGLREFDAFLLVVDGVPWGGAFNPDLATLDLTNVERIEILRGAAPVLYGATSFIGVIHVIHRAADATPRVARVTGGSYGSFDTAMFSALPALGDFKQSLSVSFTDNRYRDHRSGFKRGHVLYRGAGDTRWGKLRLDFDATMVGQDPASPHPRVGKTLSPFIPLDANHNPRDARQDEDRYHLVAGHSLAAFSGEWTTTVAVTHAQRSNLKGFLREGPFDVPVTADGFAQEVGETDVYFASHLAQQVRDDLQLIVGADELYGKGRMHSNNFEYVVSPDGSHPPRARAITVDERPRLTDLRSFTGLYGQAIWSPAPRWRLELGTRLNVTYEKRSALVKPGDAGSGGGAPISSHRNDTRGGGSAGLSFRAWSEGRDAVWLFTSYRNTFKPAAIDFGPEAEGDILKPEDAETVEAGLKGAHAGGRFTWELSGFHMQFSNVVVATRRNGLPALANVGRETLDGVEAEAAWHLGDAAQIRATYAFHDAEFGDYLADFDGTVQQLEGNRVEMSARHLAGLGLLYLPAQGVNANLIAQYTGSRFLDKRNTARAGAYALLSAGVGYRCGSAEIRVDAYNLTNQRNPVAESELGDAQYYRLPARTVIGTLVYQFGD